LLLLGRGTALARQGHPLATQDFTAALQQGTRTMTSNRIPALIAGLILATTLGACADMTPRERSTAVGAGVGAAAGAVLTGSPTGTAAGAAVGGVVGNQIKR
jgi:osmotically inducible lipoprotein OsmB